MLPGIFKAALVPTTDLFHIRGWVFFIPFKYDPFKERKRKKRKKIPKSDKRKKSRMPSGILRMIAEAVGSLRIRKLTMDIDTDDFVLNAWLVPVFSVVNSENIHMSVNFQGSLSLLLDLRARLGTLLWIMIRNKYKSFINL
jgi:hypothetical protein